MDLFVFYFTTNVFTSIRGVLIHILMPFISFMQWNLHSDVASLLPDDTCTLLKIISPPQYASFWNQSGAQKSIA